MPTQRHRPSYWPGAALLCGLVIATTTPAHGQGVGGPGGQVAQPPTPFVLSISGGISLGSYQAGVNWGLLELVRAVNHDSAFANRLKVGPYRLAAAAGASAGNINTLLWAIESCTTLRGMPPESSLFYKFWVDVGLTDLLPRRYRPSSEHGLLDRSFIRTSVYPLLMERMRSKELDPNCNVPVGLTLTRIRPDTLPVDDLDIETQRSATVFTVRAEDSAGTRRLLFAEDQNSASTNPRFGKLVLLPSSTGRKGDQIPDSAVFAAVEASSAFPLAFQPKQLQVYRPGRGTGTAWYMDGGVFDNNPVNLAVDLYAQANPRTASRDSARDSAGVRSFDIVELVFVNPARLRGTLQTRRGSAEVAEVVPGGMRSVVQLLGGAVPTARQYELQLWARGQGLPGQEQYDAGDRDSVAVRLTSRGHPLVGEHLGAFAGFLGRPFREYDFYVGVYDALHFAVRTYACNTADESPDCVPTRLHRLITEPRLPFGDIAPPVLHWLFRREYPRFPVAGDRVRWPAAARDSQRVNVLLALARANDTQYELPDGSDCRNANIPGQVLCRDGFLKLIQAWKGDDSVQVRSIVRDWRDECGRAKPRGGSCAAEEDLLALVDNPVRFTANTIDLVLDRMQSVERAVQRDMRAAAPRSKPYTGRSAEPVAEALTAFYRSRPLRPRNGFEWNPSSVPGPSSPRRDSWAWIAGNLLPYRVASNLGDTGWELGYVGALHLTEHVSIIAPVTAGSARKYGNVPAGEGNYHYFAGGGAGLALRGVLPTAASLIVPELGATVQRLGMSADPPHSDAAWMGEAYIDFAALAGRLRLGVRRTSEADQLHNGRWALSAGVADLNGFLYWTGKLLR